MEHSAPARELYTGSMFKDALNTADHIGNPVMILSAKYGMLKDSEIVEPYNVKMGDAETVAAETLSAQLNQLVNQGVSELSCFLPKAYFQALKVAAQNTPLKLVNHYEGTKGIGFQKAVLKAFRADTRAA